MQDEQNGQSDVQVIEGNTLVTQITAYHEDPARYRKSGVCVALHAWAVLDDVKYAAKSRQQGIALYTPGIIRNCVAGMLVEILTEIQTQQTALPADEQIALHRGALKFRADLMLPAGHVTTYEERVAFQHIQEYVECYLRDPAQTLLTIPCSTGHQIPRIGP